MKINVISIPVDGPIRVQEIDADDINDYQRLCGGGYVISIRLHAPDAVMWLDEDGEPKSLPPNHRATSIAWQHGYPAGGMPRSLVGDAFIAGPGDTMAAATAAPEYYVQALVKE